MAALDAFTSKPLSAPLGVYLNLTRQCNMRCVYCCVEAVRPRRNPDRELTDEEMLGLVDQLVDARVFRFILTGGEIFLRRGLLFSILERVTPVGEATLLTNATLIRNEEAKRLVTFRPRLKVALSIDAPEEEQNRVTRGRHFLARTLRGAHRLMEHGLVPAVNCVLSRSNHQRLPDLVEFLKREGFTHLFVNQLHAVGYARQLTHLHLSHEEHAAALRKIKQLQDSETGLRISPGDGTNWEGLENKLCQGNGNGSGTLEAARLLPCSAGTEQCSITADGWVTPCNSMLAYRCGNVREQPFLVIWQRSPQLAKLRSLRQTPITEVPECTDCRYETVCRGGCRALALAHGGDLLSWDPSCPYHVPPAGSEPAPSLLPVIG